MKLNKKDLTGEQKSTLIYIWNCAKRIKSKIDNDDLNEDDKERLSSKLDEFMQEFSNVYYARDIRDEHIRKADMHISAAEELNEKWGF